MHGLVAHIISGWHRPLGGKTLQHWFLTSLITALVSQTYEVQLWRWVVNIRFTKKFTWSAMPCRILSLTPLEFSVKKPSGEFQSIHKITPGSLEYIFQWLYTISEIFIILAGRVYKCENLVWILIWKNLIHLLALILPETFSTQLSVTFKGFFIRFS